MGQGTQAMQMRKRDNRGSNWEEYEEEKPKQKTLDEFTGDKK